MDAAQTPVGVIGLGHMGSRVASKLLEAGFDLRVWDRDAGTREALAGQGATAASSPLDAASGVAAAFSVLADDDAVREIVLDGRVLDALPESAVFADLSTTSIELARELAEAGSEAGVEVLDVEMSGSTPQVEAGELVLLVGGSSETLERARPFLTAISKTIVHLGGPGAGAIGKLVTNTLLGIGMEALAEGIALGEAAGLDRDRLLDMLDQLAVVAPAHKPKIALAREDKYPVAFALRLMSKDFGLALDLARELGIQLPATEASARIAAEELEAATEDVDFAAVIRRMTRGVNDAPQARSTST
ncbi:MAG TPA: NAD(P)-dependent oxidoreductase [Gaiellaceae bacterium]|jgi:3-hydroxyisobutyrate dehydrogenase|nr:NAD(P)-dependent oxidoreductase [Gaiellaceae bacterium]